MHPFADVLLPEPEHDAGAMAPAGQLWTTVEDLSRWATFAGGDTAEVLSADTLAEMYEPHTINDNPGQPWTTAHGLGWQVWNVDGTRYAGHGGSMPGFLAGLRVEVESGDGVVILTNSTSGMGAIAPELLTAYVEREPRIPEPWHAAGDPSVLELVGTWHWGPSVSTAKVVGEHLVLGEPGQARGSRFAPTGPDEWVGLDGYYTGEPLRVVRSADGAPSHLDLASFRFTRTPYDPAADVPGGVRRRRLALVQAARDLSRLQWPRLTQRLALRPLTLDDVDAVHAYRCLPEVVVHLSHDVLSRDQVRHRIARRIERGRPGAAEPLLGLAVEELRTGRVVGDVMLRIEPSHSIARMPTDEWEGTIGYALHPDVQGRGLAAEAAAELLVIGFRELRLRRITADAYADNIASNRVLRRIGMRHEATTRAKSLGKDGTWLDDNTWALLREEWRG